MLALFGAGSFFMRSSACIINDIFDKEYDRKVITFIETVWSMININVYFLFVYYALYQKNDKFFEVLNKKIGFKFLSKFQAFLLLFFIDKI